MSNKKMIINFLDNIKKDLDLYFSNSYSFEVLEDSTNVEESKNKILNDIDYELKYWNCTKKDITNLKHIKQIILNNKAGVLNGYTRTIFILFTR